MHVFKLSLTALAATFAWGAAAHAIEVKEKGAAPGTPAGVWAVVGDFCAIKDWHPAVAECEQFEEGGDTYRVLTLGDGGKIKEKLTDTDDTSYSYDIVEGPLPVKNYSAKLKIEKGDKPDRVKIRWKAEFDADGVDDEEAEGLITGIFKDGIKGIKKAAGGTGDKD